MFGIDFSELVVIMLVALVVIGPERLPKVARTLGHLWGRGQRYVNNIKADISREMENEDFSKLKEEVQQVQKEANSAEQAVRLAGQTIDQQAQQLNSFMTNPEQAIKPVMEKKPLPVE